MHIRVKVFPSAKKNQIVEKDKEVYDIFVQEPAQNNLANKRVCILLAGHFGVPRNDVQIITGHKKSQKLIKIVT